MSLLSRATLLNRVRRSKESRKRLVESNLSKGIAYQIKATRDAQKKTQADLARESGMTPNNLSRLESPDYGKQTISSLKRIAVALVVRLVPFSQYIDWLSGTPRIDEGLNSGTLAVPSFDDEEQAGLTEESRLQIENPQMGFGISIGVQINVGVGGVNSVYAVPYIYGQTQPAPIFPGVADIGKQLGMSIPVLQPVIQGALNQSYVEETYARVQ